jgi:hypothetical protein
VDKSCRATVSLTVMVKDEEKNLPACLSSVRGLFDEIVSRTKILEQIRRRRWHCEFVMMFRPRLLALAVPAQDHREARLSGGLAHRRLSSSRNGFHFRSERVKCWVDRLLPRGLLSDK